jgi:hypothetical protein
MGLISIPCRKLRRNSMCRRSTSERQGWALWDYLDESNEAAILSSLSFVARISSFSFNPS